MRTRPSRHHRFTKHIANAKAKDKDNDNDNAKTNGNDNANASLEAAHGSRPPTAVPVRKTD